MTDTIITRETKDRPARTTSLRMIYMVWLACNKVEPNQHVMYGNGMPAHV
jgi:hypothetical protein